MPDKSTGVLLISSDAGLIERLRGEHPPGIAFEIIPPARAADPGLPPAAHVWVDLEGGSEAPVFPAARYIYFYADRPGGRGRLPAGVYIRKPCSREVAALLWTEVEVAEHPGDARAADSGQTDGALPGWTAAFHLLDLHGLCDALVHDLPGRLGFEAASLYLYDGPQRLLTLAGSSCAQAVPLAVRVEPGATSAAALAALNRCLVRTDELAAALCDGESLAGVIVFSAARERVQTEIEGAGASAASAKPTAPRDDAALRAALGFLGRCLAHAREHERVRLEARLDGLTGLYNYRWLVDTLRREIVRAERFHATLSVLLIDLDELKTVNDREGHLAGDALLRHIAGKVRAALRQVDAAARSGGDEIVVILPATSAAGARLVGDRILRSIRDDPATHRGAPLKITASVGIAEWQPGWNAESLLEAADRMMYVAKRAGRDRMIGGEEAPTTSPPAELPATPA